jgi:hypothetical protein
MALTRVTSGGIAPGVQITFDQNNNPASPAVTFEGTAGTGMYSPANNQLAFATGGVERLKIDGSGNITVSGSAFLQVTNNERVVFVSQSDPNATDAVSNNGRSINKPFLTIERALIEVARLSYVPGTGDEQGEVGADDFEKYTVIVFPGDYTVDNRPGIANTTGITAGTLGDIFRYNSPNGGVIVPRGTSIVGLDLRKTVVRPRFVPDPEIGGESAIFRLTGGCYIWQLTIKDPSGVVRRGSTDTNWSTNPFSCHKMAGFKYATSSDLNFYYQKVNAFDANIPATANEFIQRVEENTIVGTKTINTIDTVASASPYIFNLSLRSTFGMCGMHADGNDAAGFQSMVVAQFTGISLQKDNNAFNAGKTHTDVTATYKTNWRHYHIKASNNAFIQVVSVFAVGYADHFIAESGGDVSITNSNSNFGNVAIKSVGFKSAPYALDQHGRITHVVAPKAFGKYIPGGNDNDVQKVRWTNIDVQETVSTLGTSGSSQTNARIYLFGIPSDPSYDKELISNAGGTYRVGLNPTEYIFIPKLSTADSDDYVQLTLIGNSNPSLDSTQWNWFKYDSVKGKWYIEYNTAGITALRNEFYSSGSIRSQWQLLTSESSFVERRTGTRSAEESLWKVRFVIPKTRHFQYPGVSDPGRPPEPGYVVRTSASNKRVYTIYSVDTKQPLSPTRDGIYYLTILLGDAVSVKNNQLSTDADADKHYQNKVYLYPTLNPDFPLDNPERVQSTWDSDNSVVVVIGPGTTLSSDPQTKTNQIVFGRRGSLTRESVFTLLEELDTIAAVSSYSGSKLDTDTGLNNAYNVLMSSNDSEGKPKAASSDPEQRLIEIRNGTDSDDLSSTYDDYAVNLHRPSNIRASGHTWEYVGYGPGNYSTAFPDFQKLLLTENNLINSQTASFNGGASYSTGMNSRGDFYIGNQRINPITGQPQTLSSPALLVEGRDNIAAAIDNQITGLQNEFSAELSALRNNLTVESLQVNQLLRSDNGIQIGQKTITFENGQLTPLASDSDFGFATKASSGNITSVGWKNDSTGFVTPQILEAWRTANGIISTVSQSSDVYICDSIWKTWYEDAERVNSSFWSLPTYGPTQGSTNVSIKYTVLSAINGTNISSSNESTALKSWVGSLDQYKQKTITVFKTVTTGGITNTFALTLSPIPFPLRDGNKWVGFNDSNYFLPFGNFDLFADYCNENFRNSSTTAIVRARPGVYHMPANRRIIYCAVRISGSSHFTSISGISEGGIPLVYWRDEWAKHHKRANGAYTSTNTSGYIGPTSGVYFADVLRPFPQELDTIQGFRQDSCGFSIYETPIRSTFESLVFLGTLKSLDYELKYSINDFALQTGGNVLPGQYKSPRAQGGTPIIYGWLPNRSGFTPANYSDSGNYIGTGNPFLAICALSTNGFAQGTSMMNYSIGAAPVSESNYLQNFRLSFYKTAATVDRCIFGPKGPVAAQSNMPANTNYRPRYCYIGVVESEFTFRGNTLKGSEKYIIPKTLTSSFVEFDLDGVGGGDDRFRSNTITINRTNNGSFQSWVDENITINGNSVPCYTSVGFATRFFYIADSTIGFNGAALNENYVRAIENVTTNNALYNENRIYVYTLDTSATRLDNSSDDLFTLGSNYDRDFTQQPLKLTLSDASSAVYDGTSGKTIDSFISWQLNNPSTAHNASWIIEIPAVTMSLSSRTGEPVVIAAGESGSSESIPGELVTGQTSGATGYVLAYVENTLNADLATAKLYNVSGTFQTGETIIAATSGASLVIDSLTARNTFSRSITSNFLPVYRGRSNLGVASNSNLTLTGPVLHAYFTLYGQLIVTSIAAFGNDSAKNAYRLRYNPVGALYRGSFGTATWYNGSSNDDWISQGTVYTYYERDGNNDLLVGRMNLNSSIHLNIMFKAKHDPDDFLTTIANYSINGTTAAAGAAVNTSGPAGTYYHDIRLNMNTHWINAGNYAYIRLTSGDYSEVGDGKLVYNYEDPFLSDVTTPAGAFIGVLHSSGGRY